MSIMAAVKQRQFDAECFHFSVDVKSSMCLVYNEALAVTESELAELKGQSFDAQHSMFIQHRATETTSLGPV